MSRLFLIFLFFASTALLAQHKIVGPYSDHFGHQIELNSDSTFRYTWRFDLQYSWTKGIWTVKNDTVFFRMVPVYDTLTHTNEKGVKVDELVLSVDERSERITRDDDPTLLNTGGQNYQTYPKKLVFRKSRLYYIHNGNLVKKKVRGIWTQKKWRPWYFRTMQGSTF